MTTVQSILSDLRAARMGTGWVCGSYWYETHRPTFAQRISLDLRPRGYVVESEVCHEHDHRSTIHRYRLVAEPPPQQLALVAS